MNESGSQMGRFSRVATLGIVLIAVLGPGTTHGFAQTTIRGNVTIQGNVTIGSLRADDVPVKPGEEIKFTLTLDRAPNFKGGGIQYLVKAPTGGSISTGIDIYPGQVTYPITILIPAGAPAGVWTFTVTGMYDGFNTHPFNGPTQTFRVIANPDLVFPTAATIAINPSQQQLLRKAATALQIRVQGLKAAISTYEQAHQQGEIRQVLRDNVRQSLSALEVTEADFTRLATAQGQADQARVFFGDLRLNYAEALKILDRSAMATPNTQLVPAAYPAPKSSSSPAIAQATLRAFDLNELAYNVVADGGSLIFSLRVTSTPSGAAVSYYRRGDPPQRFVDPTTAVIPSLTFAIWYVKLEKDGYRTETVEYDPFHSSDHVVFVELKR